ncbi:MAG: MarR family transcriptional regulator [Lachnospiraceae bacterium]|nr:MarR family transcriptional regulator [Lachnospiraceae bacterium]
MSEQVGKNFADFSIVFFNLTKSIFRQENQIRANSLAFQVLIDLNQLSQKGQTITMSGLADDLQITKQQLSKLVNALEEKELVERIHDKENRRQVNIRITKSGQELMHGLRTKLQETTAQRLSVCSSQELLQIEQALEILMPVLDKLSSGS